MALFFCQILHLYISQCVIIRVLRGCIKLRLQVVESKNAASLYIVKSIYENGKCSSKVVEKLGTYEELAKIHKDPIAWGKAYAKKLTEAEKEASRQVIIKRIQSKLIENRPSDLNKKNQNDYKRFISSTNVTKDGEVANKAVYRINDKAIADEEMYDGFYAVCTNLDDDAVAITKINHRRWEIEECFRIMKSEFKARPVYLSRDDRIKAHFMTCFLALTIQNVFA